MSKPDFQNVRLFAKIFLDDFFCRKSEKIMTKNTSFGMNQFFVMKTFKNQIVLDVRFPFPQYPLPSRFVLLQKPSFSCTGAVGLWVLECCAWFSVWCDRRLDWYVAYHKRESLSLLPVALQ